ncbi:MAG TPA: RNA polymerase sigma factor RpoD/SigA [Ohtaekwangia sp.]|uniref:sigma-70 family RNA polymerase sigma factor n=1 Tax=Ohtaekwangia sp. TaxID=2066019 RepID=UPI002F929C58
MKQLTIAKQITNREAQSLDKYLAEIGKVDLITPNMEVELTKRIRAGDTVALEKLTKANLRFVVSVAKQYQNRGLSLNDLINEGNIGLIKAGQRFDETRGFKFISYAVWWIRQSIIQALAEQSRIVRLPLNRVGSLSKMSKMFSTLEQQFQREPSSEELAQALDVSVETIDDNYSVSAKQVSMDTPFQNNEEASLLDVMVDKDSHQPDDSLMANSLRQEVRFALSQLQKREAQVLTLHYGLNGQQPLSLEEISHRFKLTRERVRQIKERAVQHLRKSGNINQLLTYLG